MGHHGKREKAQNAVVSTPLSPGFPDMYNACEFAPCMRVYWQRFACSR